MEWGGKREGAGRKKGSVKQGAHSTGRLVISCLEEEEEKIRELAGIEGKSVSRFVVDRILGK